MGNQEHILPHGCVLIAGGGPVGMLLATVLAFYGVKSLVLERNETTTKWPKMDLTNCRSMELLRKIGLDVLLRQQGVPSHIPYRVLFSNGLNASGELTKWILPSVDEYREIIKSNNDGTQPREPYQRISQSIFEAALRSRCETNELIDLRFGWKVEAVEETADGVRTTVTELTSGETWTFISAYAVACDGASSKVRRSLNIALDGGPTPIYACLVHFKSKDLERLHKQGRFWHLFTVFEQGSVAGAAISQDEADTWTVHMFLPIEEDAAERPSEEIIATVLGGATGKYPITVDEILVRSTYRPHIAVARNYRSPGGRVFLAGDAAHQNIPTGGYGMNMGIGDAFDLGWKLAAVLNGQGKEGLLQSYEEDRRPVALLSVEHSGKHMAVHTRLAELLAGNPLAAEDGTEEARRLRAKIEEYYQQNDGENKDLGIEMGYRYISTVTIPDEASAPPEFNPRRYMPSTWPGMRAPHVFLSDGTAIYDKCGKGFTLVDFSAGAGSEANILILKAQEKGVPLVHLALQGEDNAYQVWGTKLALVRPDYHVAWRGATIGSEQEAERIIAVATGEVFSRKTETNDEAKKPRQFTSTGELNTQREKFEFERIGAMQS